MTTVMEEGGEQGTATVQHNLCRGPGHHFDNELLWLGGSYCFTSWLEKTLVIIEFTIIELSFFSIIRSL